MVEPGDEAVQTVLELLPKWKAERDRLDRIDRWARWNHDDPHKPAQATNEYKELVARAQAPWGYLLVSSWAQTLYVEGYRRSNDAEDTDGWDLWQANGMDGHQVPITRTTGMYGLAYGTVLPGKASQQLGDGPPAPQMRGNSPRDFYAAYEDPAWDDWPIYGMRVIRRGAGWDILLLDDQLVHPLRLSDLDISGKPSYNGEATEHRSGVCPVVRFKNRFDLEGRLAGEVEPFIPLLGRIDQTVFDRLVVQRFGAWIVRTIAGMSVTKSADATGESAATLKMRLKVEDLLTAEDKDTKFGSLPATQLDGFIKAKEADLTDLAATSQTPFFELMRMENIAADTLVAAKSSQQAKSDESKHTLGEDYEQFIRLALHQAGRTEAAADFSAQVRWGDTTIRSLSQAADAYAKLVEGLKMPPEILWPKVPGMTQQDVEDAKAIVAKAGGMDALMRSLIDGTATPESLLPAA